MKIKVELDTTGGVTLADFEAISEMFGIVDALCDEVKVSMSEDKVIFSYEEWNK